MNNKFMIAIKLHLWRLDINDKVSVVPINNKKVKVEIKEVPTDIVGTLLEERKWEAATLCSLLEDVPSGKITGNNYSLLVKVLNSASYDPGTKVEYITGVTMKPKSREWHRGRK